MTSTGSRTIPSIPMDNNYSNYQHQEGERMSHASRFAAMSAHSGENESSIFNDSRQRNYSYTISRMGSPQSVASINNSFSNMGLSSIEPSSSFDSLDSYQGSSGSYGPGFRLRPRISMRGPYQQRTSYYPSVSSTTGHIPVDDCSYGFDTRTNEYSDETDGECLPYHIMLPNIQ